MQQQQQPQQRQQQQYFLQTNQQTSQVPKLHQTTPASSSARLASESVLIVAQSLSHLPPLSDGAAGALALDTEYRLRQIVQDAVKFMKHAKRSRLQPHDINAALRLRNAEPVYGFGAPASSRESLRQQQQQNKLNKSQKRQSPLPAQQSPQKRSRLTFAHSSGRAATSNAASNPSLPPSVLAPRASPAQLTRESGFLSVSGVPNLFFETEVELNVRAATEAPLPPVPLEVTVCAHWLVLDSVQPRISQNPLRLRTSLGGTALARPSSDPRSTAATAKASIPRTTLASSSAPDHAPNSVQAIATRTEVKPVVKHVLSRELQQYYETLTSIFYANDVSRVQSCLASVADEPGIVELMPYLSVFISKSVREHTRNLPLLLSLVRLFDAMLENSAFRMESYLHQMLPSIITCLVGKRLCVDAKHNHWGLRDYTAGVLRRVCAQFVPSYTNLQGRITRTLTEAIDSGRRPLTTHYGAIVGLAALGPVVVGELLRPRLDEYAKKVAAVVQNGKAKPIRQYEARKVYAALAWALSIDDNKPNGLSRVSALPSNGKKADVQQFPLDGVTVVPQKVDQTMRRFSKLLPSLQKDLGRRLYPYGERLSPSELADAIAAQGGYKESDS